MKLRNIFTSRDSLISFSGLIVGFMAIMAATLFMSLSYLSVVKTNASTRQVVSGVMQIVGMANTFPAAQANKELKNIPKRGFHARITRKMVANADEVDSFTRSNIAAEITGNKDKFNIVIPLENANYLHVWGYQSHHGWMTAGYVFSLAVLFLALVSLCAWSIKRVAAPIAAIGVAAKRFGRDIQAPALPLTGSDDMQEVIKAFNDMQNRIRRLLNDRTQMLAAISHDLRTPITRLKLRVEYLKEQNQYEKALVDLQQMEDMITSVLSFARDYTSEESLSTFDLNGLLESMCDDMLDSGHDIEYQGLTGRVPYTSRLIAMKRALANLIDNAIKYGKVVSVSLEKQANKFVIQIADRGPGIPDKEKERAFAPFYRVDPSRSHEIHGTGLGLAVARDIIHAAGGEIELRDALPHGLIVVVVLPGH